jgi:hypothetical protein
MYGVRDVPGRRGEVERVRKRLHRSLYELYIHAGLVNAQHSRRLPISLSPSTDAALAY